MNLYRLHDQIKYRSEPFGCTIIRLDLQETRFYNEAGAQIIALFRQARTMADVSAALAPSTDEERNSCRIFVEELAHAGVIAACDDDERSAAAWFESGRDPHHPSVASPLGVEIELTLKCGRACSYCAYEALPTFSTEGELDTGAWIEILHRLRNAGIFFVRFTGGDPLLRPDFSELLAAADALGFVITVGSDLTVLDDAAVAALASASNLYALQTTLDGPTAAVADRLRGRGNFDKVVAGVARLKKAGVPVIVGTVLSKHNVGEVYETAKLMGGLGVDGYCVAPLYAAGRGQSRAMRALVPDNDDLAAAAAAFDRAVQEGLVQPADPAWLETASADDDAKIGRIWEDQPHLVRVPNQLIRIDPRGRVYSSIKLKPTLREDVYLGDIRDQDLIEIWNESPLLQTLRSLPSRPSYFGDVIDVRDPTFSQGRH